MIRFGSTILKVNLKTISIITTNTLGISNDLVPRIQNQWIRNIWKHSPFGETGDSNHWTQESVALTLSEMRLPLKGGGAGSVPGLSGMGYEEILKDDLIKTFPFRKV